MKRLLTGILALATMVVTIRADVWGEDYAEAMARAKQEGKYILLDFTGSDWCGWCKRLDAELSDKFGVAGYPTIILLDPDGNYAGQTGYMPGGSGRFVENLKSLIDQARARKAGEQD
ncbi:MAG: thioredoxin family protein [bacterium]